MKKTILLGGVLLAGSTMVQAQTDDPMSLSMRTLRIGMEDPVLGSARYSAMGGAMGALGGDGSTLRDNPAGLGIYRKSDIGITGNVLIDNDQDAHFNINNFSAVFNFGDSGNRHGYVTSSFAIAYNRLNNLYRSTFMMYTSGYKYPALDGSVEYTEDGGSGEVNFGYGVNISNHFFLGLTLNCGVIDYQQTSILSDRNQATDGIVDYDLEGSGFSFGIGGIFRPNKYFRVGAAFHSPMWYNIKEYDAYPITDDAGTYLQDRFGYTIYNESRDDEMEYKIQTPLKFEAGVGFVLGKRAAIDVDYILQNQTAYKLKDGYSKFRAEKSIADNDFKTTHTIKAGAEIQIVDGLCGRLGYAYRTSPTEDGIYGPQQDAFIQAAYSVPKESDWYSIGLGYKGKCFYVDLAYVLNRNKEDFYASQQVEVLDSYDPDQAVSEDNPMWVNDNVFTEKPIKQTLKNHNIIATIGWKF